MMPLGLPPLGIILREALGLRLDPLHKVEQFFYKAER
jgi:hypothetical protein